MPERTLAQPMARRAKGGTPGVKPARRASVCIVVKVGEVAERFKAPVLTAEAGCRSEHRRSRWPAGRRAGRPESNRRAGHQFV